MIKDISKFPKMYINYYLYLLFSFHCVAKPLGGPQDGLPSEPQLPQPGGPQDGPSGAPDHNPALSTDLFHPQPGGPQDGPSGAPDDNPALSTDHLHSQPGGPPHDGLPGAHDDDYQYDDDDLTYLVENAVFEEINIETIAGNKKDSLWLIVNNQYICVKNYESASGASVYWECRTRRITGCPFKLQTEVDNEGKHSIVYMYNEDRHTCHQDATDVYEQKFRNIVKGKMATDYRTLYAAIYDKAKNEMLQNIEDINLRERIRLALPTSASLRSASMAARRVPIAPKTFEDIDLQKLNDDKINISKYVIAESKDDGIYIFGTKELAREFANSIFKSADATFKICPKMFYQVFLFLAMVGGVYVTCMFAIMPNKTGNSYMKVFNMIHDAFSEMGLDVEWRNHSFMTDFEIAMRNGIRAVFPLVKLLGCFFHFAQVSVIYYFSKQCISFICFPNHLL